jgi:hypothetical protein
MPRRPSIDQLAEGVASIFGIYRGVDPNVMFPVPDPIEMPVEKGAPPIKLRRSLEIAHAP